MAITTSTELTTLTNGTPVEYVYSGAGAPIPLIDRFALLIPVKAGYADSAIAITGARITTYPSAYSEGASAPSTVATNVPTQIVVTPNTLASAGGLTNEAINAVAQGTLDAVDYVTAELRYPHETRAYKSSDGLYAQVASASNVVGTSGATLELATLLAGHRTICTNLGITDVPVVCILDQKGISDLMQEQLFAVQTNAAASQQFVEDVFVAFWNENGIPRENLVAKIGQIYIYKESKPAPFTASGGDFYAPMFVPEFGRNVPPAIKAQLAKLSRGIPGNKPLAPAFMVCFREDPTPAIDLVAIDSPLRMDDTTAAGTPLRIRPYPFVGQGQAVVGVWGSYVADIISEASLVALRYVAT